MFGVRGREKGWTGGAERKKELPPLQQQEVVKVLCQESVPWINFLFLNYAVNFSNRSCHTFCKNKSQ